MPSSHKIDPRRKMFLYLAGQIESQLREAYARKYQSGTLTQSSLAKKLGVNRSAVHRRLTGQTNMTIETIADMVWALDHAISVKIYDPMQKSAINYEPIIETSDSLQTRSLAIPTDTKSASTYEWRQSP